MVAYAYRKPKTRGSLDKFKTSLDIVRNSQHKNQTNETEDNKETKGFKNNVNLINVVAHASDPSTWEMEVRDYCKFETRPGFMASSRPA